MRLIGLRVILLLMVAHGVILHERFVYDAMIVETSRLRLKPSMSQAGSRLEPAKVGLVQPRLVWAGD